jgi:hypothetical protein
MFSVAISPKGDNYPRIDKSEINESLHCTNQESEDRIPTFSVPTKGQRRKPFEHTRILNKPNK